MFLNGRWGTVCSIEEVTTAEAATLCNSLGFGPPQSVVGGALYGDSMDIPILVNKLVCQVTQDHFSQCRVIMNQISSCTHDNDIGLICSRKYCALINIIQIPVFAFLQLQLGFLRITLGLHGREKLKCIMVDSGTACVMLTGISMMLTLYAGSLAFLGQVQPNMLELHLADKLMLYWMGLCAWEQKIICLTVLELFHFQMSQETA